MQQARALRAMLALTNASTSNPLPLVASIVAFW